MNSDGKTSTAICHRDQWWPVTGDTDVMDEPLYDALRDACAAHLLGGRESYVFVYISLTASNDKACVARIPPPAFGSITITTHTIPDYIPIDFIFATEDQPKATRLSYDSFAQWSDGALAGDAPDNAILVIKLLPSCHWFIRFPLTSYINFGFAEFSRYAGAQWIVSDRNFSTVIANRIEMRETLSDIAELVKGTLIVCNNYHHHLLSAVGDSVRSATRILDDLLTALQHVHVGSEIISLRFLINPSATRIRDELTDSRTRFVFAAFEARNGSWEIAGTDPVVSQPEFFDLSQLRDRLAHVQLLRIFHCYSAFRPGVESEPADPDTLVGQLLATGAQMVEGGITEESYFDFASAVLQFLFKTSLRTALEARQIQGRLDLASIVDSANEFLTRWGYEPVSS